MKAYQVGVFYICIFPALLFSHSQCIRSSIDVRMVQLINDNSTLRFTHYAHTM